MLKHFRLYYGSEAHSFIFKQFKGEIAVFLESEKGFTSCLPTKQNTWYGDVSKEGQFGGILNDVSLQLSILWHQDTFMTPYFHKVNFGKF